MKLCALMYKARIWENVQPKHCTILLNNHSLKWFWGTTKRTRKSGRISKLSWYNRTSLQHGFAGFSSHWQMLIGIDAHSVDAPLQTHQLQSNNPQAPIQIPHGISGRSQFALLPVCSGFCFATQKKILNSHLLQSLWLWTQACVLPASACFPPSSRPSHSKIHGIKNDWLVWVQYQLSAAVGMGLQWS